MSKRKITYVLMLVFLVLSAGLQYKVRISGVSKSGLELNTQAPNFGRNDTKGDYYILGSLKGKIIILIFWSSSSPESIMGMEAVKRWVEFRQRGEEAKDEIVLAINNGEKMKEMIQFGAEREIPFPILLDDGMLKERYNVRRLPSLFVVDSEGRVRKFQEGYSPDLIQSVNGSVEEIKKRINQQ